MSLLRDVFSVGVFVACWVRGNDPRWSHVCLFLDLLRPPEGWHVPGGHVLGGLVPAVLLPSSACSRLFAPGPWVGFFLLLMFFSSLLLFWLELVGSPFLAAYLGFLFFCFYLMRLMRCFLLRCPRCRRRRFVLLACSCVCMVQFPRHVFLWLLL